MNQFEMNLNNLHGVLFYLFMYIFIICRYFSIIMKVLIKITHTKIIFD